MPTGTRANTSQRPVALAADFARVPRFECVKFFYRRPISREGDYPVVDSDERRRLFRDESNVLKTRASRALVPAITGMLLQPFAHGIDSTTLIRPARKNDDIEAVKSPKHESKRTVDGRVWDDVSAFPSAIVGMHNTVEIEA